MGHAGWKGAETGWPAIQRFRFAATLHQLKVNKHRIEKRPSFDARIVRPWIKSHGSMAFKPGLLAFWALKPISAATRLQRCVSFSFNTGLSSAARRLFRDELFAALKILDEGHIDRQGFKGSWAGAIGKASSCPPIFWNMPRILIMMAKDIWHSEADVFASIANYLRENGWSDDHTWGRKVLVPTSLRSNFEALLPTTDGADCRALTRHTPRETWVNGNRWA